MAVNAIELIRERGGSDPGGRAQVSPEEAHMLSRSLYPCCLGQESPIQVASFEVEM